MNLAAEEFLSPDDVSIDVAASDKHRLLLELSKRAAARLGLDESAVGGEIVKREALGSTGVGRGIAIPHARFAGVRKPFALLARLRRGIDFDAIDGEPVDIVVLLLMPADPDAGQMNVLAAIARKLRSPETVSRLRKARTAAELFAAFTAPAASI